MLVDRRARPFLGMGGDARETEINGRAVHIVGRFGLGPDFMSNGTVMMSERTFAGLLTGNRNNPAALPVEFGVVKAQPGADIAAVAAILVGICHDEVLSALLPGGPGPVRQPRVDAVITTLLGGIGPV